MKEKINLHNAGFRERVLEVVRQIPYGKVMTYGQIAALCGQPRAARIVGGIAHWGDVSLPWHRVVKKDGSLAEGYPGGVAGHETMLASEGIPTDKAAKIDIERFLWRPHD